ncbi:Protein lifeguard 1 [Frankliniella fusca]|uniref:Protein lifeguard 1 n=1 Tax=Frankliniella fusca TaxID=407009 RepID=A0AAE1HE37_9NEOP|nr:Protein lifeguard 1 [Frankliniella fusca]
MSAWQPQPGYYPDQDPNKQAPPGGATPFYPGGYPQQPSYPAYPPPSGQPSGVPPPYGAFVPPPNAPPFGQGPPPPQTNMYGGPGSYPEDPLQDSAFSFSDQSIRRGFIRKVYLILMGQLLVTTAIIAIFTFHTPTNRYVRGNIGIFYAAMAVMIVCLICMACCSSVRRKAPTNIIFLGIFTLAESFMLGTAAASFKSEEVVMAAGITAIVCFSLTIFALQTKWDFTVLGGALFVAVIVLFVFGIIVAFIPGKAAQIAYASVGALLFSVYLIYDTQMMMGGKHKYSISPEEYIFAALNLYLDIINIFIYILSIIGASRD